MENACIELKFHRLCIDYAGIECLALQISVVKAFFFLESVAERVMKWTVSVCCENKVSIVCVDEVAL